MYYMTTYESPAGLLTVASDGAHIVGLWIEGQKYYGGTVSEEMQRCDDVPVFESTKDWLDCYFAGGKPDMSELPLRPAGGAFRQGVWEILREIPYGEVTTYGKIAERMAEKMGRRSMSGQAVGGAVAHNPISILIPCHRVVGANGSLTGYAGGIDTKVKLLQLEGATMERLFIPKK